MTKFAIDNNMIGRGEKTFVVAEVGLVHDGSLGNAHCYIDAVADSGADAVKFQTHIALAESTYDEAFRVPFSYEDPTRYHYWDRTSFTEEQWKGLADHCVDRGIVFLSTPFSAAAVEMLDRVGVPAWKVGSGDLSNQEILDAIIATKKPVILSTGMARWSEIELSVNAMKSNGISVAALQCTSKYPVQFEEVGLNNIKEIEARFNVPSGLSDHSGTIFPALACMARGGAIVELHVVFDKRMFGPDTAASVHFDELKTLCEARDAFYAMQAPVDKELVSKELSGMRTLFGRSLALRKDAAAGTKITNEHLTLKKPGTGIPNSERENIIGKRLARDVRSTRLLRWNDVGEPFEEA